MFDLDMLSEGSWSLETFGGQKQIRKYLFGEVFSRWLARRLEALRDLPWVRTMEGKCGRWRMKTVWLTRLSLFLSVQSVGSSAVARSLAVDEAVMVVGLAVRDSGERRQEDKGGFKRERGCL